MSNYFKIFLFLCFVGSSLSYSNNAENNQGVKGGRSYNQQGLKSYSGFISGQHQPKQDPQNFHQQPQVPFYYHPYGWNLNNQPQKTYSGVVQQSQPHSGFGWFGNNQFGGSSSFPNLPPLFVPSFTPPVYYPNNFQYPNYPNTFPFHHHQHNYGTTYPNQYPQQTTVNPYSNQFPEQTTARPSQVSPGRFPNTDNRFPNVNQNPGPATFPNENPTQSPPPQTEMTTRHSSLPRPTLAIPTTTRKPDLGDDQEFHPNKIDTDDFQFPSSAFFKPDNNKTTNFNRGPWSENDELAWQATTKRPYFENKVPGLDCVLPAASVFGATTALKTSLLPLTVPAGKPILSCNATQLLQSQIYLDGIIYDCNGGAITMSCPKVDNYNSITDECLGETLECDVRMRADSRSVTCTNGTLVSNNPIFCKSATLMNTKNILNCVFSGGSGFHARPTQKPVFDRTTNRVSVVPLEPAPVTENSIFDTRISETDQMKTMPLNHQVKVAMKNVFPPELLSIDESKMYLPPTSMSQSKNPIPQDVKKQMNGVFPHELLAMSQTEVENSFEYDDDDTDTSLRLSQTRVNIQPASISEQRRSEWDINSNKKTGNPSGSIKTSYNRLPTKFGSDSQPTANDRLLFKP